MNQNRIMTETRPRVLFSVALAALALAGMVTPLIVGYSVDTFGSWNFPLYAMGVFFLLGALCWILIDPTRPVFEEQAEVSLSPALSPQI